MKGGVFLSAKGYIQVKAYTSYAEIPLKDVSVTITNEDGTVVALRLSNRNGAFDAPIEITVPEVSAGLTPNTGVVPFATVNLYAQTTNYEGIEILGIQVFPNVLTVQNLEMIPLSELPGNWDQRVVFDTPPQNL